MASPVLTRIKQNLQSLGQTPAQAAAAGTPLASQPVPPAPAGAATGGQTGALTRAAVAATGREADVAAPAPAADLETAATFAAQQDTEAAQRAAGAAAGRVVQAESALTRGMQAELDALSEQQLNQRHEYQKRATDIARGLQQGRAKMSFARQKLAAEQVGFLTRMTSKKYVDELQAAGKRKRIDTAAGFKNAVLETTFQDMEDLLKSDLQFRRALGADDREFKKYMANMDLNMALNMAAGQVATQAAANQYTGLSGLASAAAQTYAATGKTSGIGSTTPSTQAAAGEQGSPFAFEETPEPGVGENFDTMNLPNA